MMLSEAPTSDLPVLVTAEWLSFVEALNADNLGYAVLAAGERAAEAGFSGLEIPLPHAEPLFATHGEAFWGRMGDRLKTMGVPIRTIHGPTLAPLDVPIGEAIDQLQISLRVAEACGAEVIVVHPTPHSHPHVTSIARDLLNRDVQVCRAVADMLTGPTRLAVENLPTYGIAHLERIMDNVPDPRVGVCFDTGHWCVRPEGTIEQVIQRLGGRIIHWHLSDNDGWTDQHLPPGRGTFPWKRWSGLLDPSQWSLPMLVELSVPLRRDDMDAAECATGQWRDARCALLETLAPLAPENHTNLT